MNPPTERVTVHAERVDDFNDRRYLVTVTLIVPAESIADAVELVVGTIGSIT